MTSFWVKFYSTAPIEILPDDIPQNCRTVSRFKEVVKAKLPLKLGDYGTEDFSLLGPDGQKLDEWLSLDELPEHSGPRPLRVVINGRFSGLTSLVEIAYGLKSLFSLYASSSLSSQHYYPSSSPYTSPSTMPSSLASSPEELESPPPLYSQNSQTEFSKSLKIGGIEMRRRNREMNNQQNK